MELDKSLIILALETLSEQVSDGTDWGCYESSFEGQERLDRIDKQIEELTWFEGDPPTRTINEYRQVKTFGYTQKED
jgi:hypothetical protein